MITIVKYKDISELFKFTISDNKISTKEFNVTYEQYVYEIIPLSILEYSNEIYYNILSCYIEFLKGMDCRFKILIRNHKFNIDEYLKNIKQQKDELKRLDFYDEYIKSIENMISSENIYYSSMYLCISCTSNKIKVVEENINRLKSIGIMIVKLENKDLENTLYESINKL